MGPNGAIARKLGYTLAVRILLPCLPIFVERLVALMVPSIHAPFPNRDVLIVAFLVPIVWVVEIRNPLVKLLACVFILLAIVPFVCSLILPTPRIYLGRPHTGMLGNPALCNIGDYLMLRDCLLVERSGGVGTMRQSFPDLLSVAAGLVGAFVAIAGSLRCIRRQKHSPKLPATSHLEVAFADLLSEKTTSLDVLGISLKQLLRDGQHSPFLECLERHGDIKTRVLLLNPYSVFALKLAQREEGVSAESYTSSRIYHEILASIRMLRGLQPSYPRLEARVYGDAAMGMILLTNSGCLFESYGPREDRQAYSSPYLVISRRRESAIYQNMASRFERVWNEAVDIASDLQSSSERQLDEMKHLLSRDKESSHLKQ